jgi:hypothetical protein
MLKLIISKFDALFNYTVDADVLTLFRKLVSIFYFINLVALFPSWNRFYGWNHVTLGASQPIIDLLSYFHFLPFEFFWVVGFFICVWHWVGNKPIYSSLALFIFHSSLLVRNPFASNGEDLVLRMLFFYSCFFPWNGEGKFRGSWAVRLAQLNFIGIYIFSYPKKLAADVAWFTGDFMYYVMVNPNWSRLTEPGLAAFPLVSPFLTYGALIFEGLIIFLIWPQKTRRLACFCIFFFHSMIAIMLNNVTFFSISMILGSILFYKKEDLILLSQLFKRKKLSTP